MPDPQIYILHSDPETGQLLERAILRPAGYAVRTFTDQQTIEPSLSGYNPDVLLLEYRSPEGDRLVWMNGILERSPALQAILIVEKDDEFSFVHALRSGVVDILTIPLRANEVLEAVQSAIRRRTRLLGWMDFEARRNTKSLQHRLDELEVLEKIGRTLTSSLDLDEVLRLVVEAAVKLTGAEEGSLLMLEEDSGELYMRAGQNFQEDFVRSFRLPVRDTLAGQVMRTGKPVLLNQDTPQKIKTAYLVHTLIYVPIQIHGRVIGVLGVDNRKQRVNFTDRHLTLIAALADYAAIALENASLYTRSEVERNKLGTILKEIEEGVIVVDQRGKLILINRIAREAFGLGEDQAVVDRPAQEVFKHQDLIDLLSDEDIAEPFRSEIKFGGGRVFNAQLTPIPGVGLAVTMQDITQLKEIDRIKSDFVSAVSHDLRSPLTAILGYVELIERVGPVTEQQLEFIRRVQVNVRSITTLINDLLDLGRIEAGLDVRKEILSLPAIVDYALDDLRVRLNEKNQDLNYDVPEIIPSVLGNPVHLRQLIGNLVGNAIKYTPEGGRIDVMAHSEDGQVFVEVGDNGPGIPQSDQPYIFDKFYRGSNVPTESAGTGLGLAIVKSIVDNHQGRIWVESSPGSGTKFTVVLPVANQRS